jgi:two-component system OmpR family response regulator
MTQRLIAVVEDEEHLRDNYREALERYGFATRGYANRAAAESGLSGPLPDLVIIDVGLAGEPEGGFDLCRALRQRSASLPIIFLTARDSDLDAVSGLRLGADDYLTKDISNQHLLARILALFRRIEASREPERRDAALRIGPVELEPDTMQVHWRERPVSLTVTEFWMVHSLLKRPGHVKSRGSLMEAASLVVDETTVTSHIKRIRRKFEALDPSFDRLETVHGAGYRWQPGD